MAAVKRFFETALSGAARGRDAIVNPLLGLGSERYVELAAESKASFDRWRCVAEPKKALTENAPFGTLSLTVDQAGGLLSGDLNGLSDPFAIVRLDGVKHFQTKVIQKTLAPKWEREIQLEVYQPFSVLSIVICDHDVGIGISSHVLGFVDLRLQHLPLNQKVAAWFELCHPDGYRDTVNGRANNDTPTPKCAGRIHLEFEFRVEDPVRELFAACLPEPDLGHGYPPMDLHDLVVTASVLSQQANNLNRSVFSLRKQIRKQITLVWFALVWIVWQPFLLLPSFVLSLGGAACYIGRRLKKQEQPGWQSEDEEDKEGEDDDGASSVEAESSSFEGQGDSGGRRHRHFQKLRDKIQCLTHTQGSVSSPTSLAASATDPAPAAEAKEGKSDFRTSLRLAQAALPKSQQMSVRMAQGQVGSLQGALDSLADLLMESGDKIGLGSVALAFVLLCLSNWQALLVKLLTTLAISMPLSRHSALGILGRSAFYYFFRRERFVVENMPLRPSGAPRDEFAAKWPHLSEEQCKQMRLSKHGTYEEGMPHRLQAARLLAVKRCRQCGKMVATGLSKKPPMQCVLCRQVFCRHCQPFVQKNCRGSEQKNSARGSSKAAP